MNNRAMHIIKVLFISCFVIISTAKINLAQESQVQFEHLHLPGGDLSNFVGIATQDSYGFMWFSTWNGLYRYDGYSFINYVHNPADSTSLSANWVETIYIDSNGTLWAGTYGGGLNRFNPDTETFTRYRHNSTNLNSLSQDSVTVITEDHLGQLWVGTMGGLNRMDRKMGTFTRYRYDPGDSTSLSNDQVRAIYEDAQGTLWIGTNSPFPGERNNPGPGGLNRFDRDSETFTRYLHHLNDPNSLTSNYIMSIFEDSRETLWIGTWDYGLATMDRETETFTRHYYSPNEPIQLTSSTNEPQSEALGGTTFIHEDDRGLLWFGSYGGGLHRYDPETGSITFFEANPDDPTSLFANSPWDMFQSQDGTHWVTIIPGGVNKIHSIDSLFKHHTLTPMHSSNFLTVLHADRSGILRVNACCPEPGTTVSLKVPETQKAGYEPIQTFNDYETNTYKAFITIKQLDDGTIWVGTYNGSQSAQTGALYLLNPETNQTIPVFIDYTDDGKRIGPISAIHEDTEGTIWLGTKYSGLFQLNRQTGQTIQYSHDPETHRGLSHESILTIHESASEPNVLWIGTDGGGLNRLDKESETFTQYRHDPDNPNSLNGEYITSIYEDRSGTLYIGTRKSGLNIFDKESGEFTHFTEYDSGLPDNNIACLLGDSNGNVWMGTSQGLVRFEPESDLFYTYGQNHGVRAQPYIESCDVDIDGQLIFGGANGFTVFHPDDVETDITTTPTVLTNFLLRGQPVEPNPNGVLQSPVWQENDILLPYSDNTFSFEFAVLDYRDPASNQYMYQLEGYDQGWQNAGTQRLASYNQVPFGEYTFRVRSANSMGLWSEQGASIRVTILPPWWHTWWAYGLYAFLFIAGIFVVDRFQRRRLIAIERDRAQKRELEQQKAHGRQLEEAYSELEDSLKKLTAAQDQLVQQEKLASLGQLTAGIAHEIKNPLNFVNNFSDLSIELVEEAREELSTLSRQLSGGEDRSPFEGGKVGEANEGDDHGLILTILNDIEMNLRKIHEHGTRADSIVKSMLQHSRGGDGKMEPTDLNALIKEYVNLAFHGMRASKEPINVNIELDLDEALGEIPLIAEDFSRVILNISNNAFDAMRSLSAERSAHGESYEPKLTVKTHRNDQSITIVIEDNGPGIPKEIKDKILQPFFTTKKGTQGTGLGLSITNDIIKAHGGSLDVHSDETDGTTFVIKLPQKNIL